ncbi:Crp/Fnr family transcriptional regulator, partial [Pseudomonadota bacterium]
MKDVLNHFLQQLGATSDAAQRIVDQAKLLELPTRHILLNQGEHPCDCFFLLEGVCHACYLTEDGRQYSKEFYWDQDVLLGFESLITGQPSPYLLETLSACQLLALPIELLQQWREQGDPL